MAFFAEMTCSVASKTDAAALLIFHEDTPHEQELWVPFKCIEDLDALEEEDEDANVTLHIAKWFLKNNDIAYD